MCLAVPCKVTELLPDQRARVELDGLKKDISLAFVGPVDVGSYVILHVGYAIGVLDPEEAEKTLALFEELDAQPPP
jgi:hydrogenase expression/formation protein HypC